MTNKMKLLMALCDALGFDVEETAEQKIPSGQILIPHDYKITKKGGYARRKKNFEFAVADLEASANWSKRTTPKGETQQDIIDKCLAEGILKHDAKELTSGDDKYIRVDGEVFKRVNLDGQ